VPERGDRELLRRYHEHGDLAAREQLINQYMSLVRSLARRYSYRGEQLEDLVQIGAIGLIKAIDRFDLERGVELTTYATPNIIGEIKRHFRDKGWSVRVPRGLQELNVQLSRLVEQLTVQLGRSPTIAELAKAAGAQEEEVLEALESGRAYSSLSLSSGGGGDGDEDLDPLESIGTEEHQYEVSEDRAVLAPGFKALDERERRILQLRFFEGLTQSQSAQQQVVVDVDLREGRRRPRHVHDPRSHHAPEPRVPHRHARERRQIPCARVVVDVDDAAGGDEVRVAEPERARLAVHLVHERRLVAARGDGERERVVVAREEEHRVEELPRLHPLARAEALLDERHARHRLVDGDNRVWPELPQREERGHDLRRRRDVPPLVCAELPEHAAGVGVDEDRGRREQSRGEPVRDQRAPGEETLACGRRLRSVRLRLRLRLHGRA